MCDVSGAAPSRRCCHNRCPPSSTMAMDTAQLFDIASASAAAAINLTSARLKTGFWFMALSCGWDVKNVLGKRAIFAPVEFAAPTPCETAPRTHILALEGTRIPSVGLTHVFQPGGLMNESLQAVYGGSSITSVEQRNRVLRNTYWLLALSLVPTVLGAWVGVSTGVIARMGVGMSVLLFMGGAFGFIYAIEKTKNSSAGVGVLLAFTFFMGLMLSRLLAMVLGFKNGPSLVMTAFGGTAAVFFAMASLSTVIKRDLSG